MILPEQLKTIRMSATKANLRNKSVQTDKLLQQNQPFHHLENTNLIQDNGVCSQRNQHISSIKH